MIFLKCTKRIYLLSCAAIFLMTAPTGCTRGEVEVRNAVAAYTQVLSEALSKPDSQKMSFFASADEVMRIDGYILLMRKDRKIMHSRIQKLDFRAVKLDKENGKATVTTHEEWTFYHVDEKSRQPVSKNEAIAYNNMYQLIREQGHWVVDRIESHETKPEMAAQPLSKPGAETGKKQQPGTF